MDSHKLSANRLAELSGVSQPSITRFLKGESSTMELDSVQAISRVFNVTVSQMIGETPLNSEGALRTAYEAMQKMAPYQVQQVITIIETLATPPDGS